MESKIRKQWKMASLDEIKRFVLSSFTEVEKIPCPVDQLRRFTDHTRRNSCGECVICREGLLQLAVVTEGITQGLGREQDVEIIKDISADLVLGSGCDYGKEVGRIVSQRIAENAEDFTRHIKRKRCDTLVCNKLLTFYVAPETCTGCSKCVDICPVSAIAGGDRLIHVIDVSLCNRCGACEDVCDDKAIIRAGAVLPKLPEVPIPAGSFQVETEAGGLMSRKRRRKSE